MKEKITSVFNLTFGAGMICIIIGGGSSLIGYMIALIMGGEIAVTICNFVFITYIPLLIRLTSILIGVGLILIYLRINNSSKVGGKNDLENTK